MGCLKVGYSGLNQLDAVDAYEAIEYAGCYEYDAHNHSNPFFYNCKPAEKLCNILIGKYHQKGEYNNRYCRCDAVNEGQ